MDASSKRSRKEAQVIHNGFAQAVRMELEVEREFETETRTVEITVMGEKQSLSVHEGFFKQCDYSPWQSSSKLDFAHLA